MLTGPYALLIKIGGALAIVGALITAVLLWGNSRENDGVEKTDRKWEEAGELLEKQAAESAKKADDESAERVAEHQDKLKKEKELLDEADRDGSSPFDVIFGN